MTDLKVAALIVAAGRGTRAGGSVPKQYAHLAGASILRRTVQAFVQHPNVSSVRVVIDPDHRQLYKNAVGGLDLGPVIMGADARQGSVFAGLEALENDPPDAVLIHDAARPLIDAETISRVVTALKSSAGAIPGQMVRDTLKRVENKNITATVARDNVCLAQTPQGFRFADILEAHRRYRDVSVTDDAAIAELAGINVMMVEGHANNIKITTPEDFALAEALLRAPEFEARTGQGFDVHRFGPGDHLWLCGIRVPHTASLVGHSDADVGLHALTDAILGTIGCGDIGTHFPPSDPKWRGVSSDQFLTHALKLLRDRNGILSNVDVTLICEFPKVTPHRLPMRERLAQILDIDIERVSVKATTTEQLGFLGRSEGIAAQAIATVRLPL